jgi:catecholate siderophore receptor
MAGLLAGIGLALPLKASPNPSTYPGTDDTVKSLTPTAANPDTAASVLMPTVNVMGTSESLAGSGLKFNGPLVYTPQSITVVNQKDFQEQGITSIRDALRDVSGLSIQAGEFSQQGDVANIDGFKTNHDFFLDGMRDFGSYYRDPFNLSEIQVLKGPDGLLFGDGSTGGVINQVSKQPQADPSYDVSLTGGTDATRRATADINQPLPDLGAHTVLRLNVMDDQGGVAQRNDAENSVSGLAPSLAFGVGTPTRLTLGYFHLDENDTPDYGVPWMLNLAAPVARQNYYGFINDYLDASVDMETLDFEHDFQDGTSLKSRTRYTDDSRNLRITEPQVSAAQADAYYAGTLPLSNIQVNPNELQGFSVETTLDNQNDVARTFKGDRASDTVQAGTEEEIQTSAPTQFSATAADLPTQNLLTPNEAVDFYTLNSGALTLKTQAYAQINLLAVYGLDTLDLGEHVELIGGLRYDHDDAYYNQMAPGATFGRFTASDNMLNWKAAAIYKPVADASVYYAAGTSTDPSAEQLSLSSATAAEPPEETVSQQVGAKWNLPHGPEWTASLFYNRMYNTIGTNPNNTLLDVDTGAEQAEGVDLGVSGHLTRNWELEAGYTGMRTDYLGYSTGAGASYVSYAGQSLQNSPNNTLDLWTEYYLPMGWEIGAGLDAVGARNAGKMVEDAGGAYVMEAAPGYLTGRAMLGYRAGKNLDLQANLDNLTDAAYLDSIQGGHVVPGAGRSLLVSTNLKF